jgi:hypothetical protein
MADEERDPEGVDEKERERRRRLRLRGVARRLLDEPGAVRDAKELLGNVLDTSDKARVEMIRIFGREVRVWLDGLGIQEGVHHIMTNYSLEVHASVSLKPLGDKIAPPPHETKKQEREDQED